MNDSKIKNKKTLKTWQQNVVMKYLSDHASQKKQGYTSRLLFVDLLY